MKRHPITEPRPILSIDLMLFQIRLLKRQFITDRKHLVPSVIEVANAFLDKINKSHQDYASIEDYFKKVVPIYYIPDHKIERGVVELEETTFYVSFAKSLPRHKREHIESTVASINSFMGQPAAWSVSEEKVAFNCFRSQRGVLVGGFSCVHHYLLNEPLPKPTVTFKAPQRIVMAIQGEVREDDALKLMNSFHKRLVSEFPHNCQCVGRYMNEFVSNEESLYLSWKAEKGIISNVIIEALTGITNEIIDFLANGFDAIFFQEELNLKFTMESNEYTAITEPSNHFKSITPVNVPMATKDSSLTKGAEATIIQNILNIIGDEKLDKSTLTRVDDWIVATTESLGELCVKATKESDATTIRGGRSSAGSYNVEVVSEKPVELLSIGAHRKYGAGRLQPIK